MATDQSNCEDHEAQFFQEDLFEWLCTGFHDGELRKEHMEAFLTRVPINASIANSVKSKIRDLVEEEFHTFYPKVVISYSTGHRKDYDVDCAGPGLIIAAAVIKLLFNKGCQCCSDMMTPEGRDWQEYMLRVNHAIVTVVLVSRASLLSVHCLREMATALKYGVELIPVRCDGKSLNGLDIARDENAMWPVEILEKYAACKSNAKSVDDELMLQRLLVVDKLSSINTLPAHGSILSEPISTDLLVQRIGRLAAQITGSSNQTNLERGIYSCQPARYGQEEKTGNEETNAKVEPIELNREVQTGSKEIGIVGVEFSSISVDEWNDYAVEKQFVFEQKLNSLLSYSEVCKGTPQMVIERIRRCDGVEFAQLTSEGTYSQTSMNGFERSVAN